MKIFLFIMIALCVLLLAALILLISYTFKRDKKHLPKEQLMQGSGDKSAIIICQPSIHNGNMSITNAIAVTLNELGYNVTINRPGTKLDYRLNKFDLIVFGSGVYMGKPSATLVDYIKRNKKFDHKKVFVFLTGIDLESTVEFEIITRMIPKTNQVQTLKLHKNDLDKATDFIQTNFAL